MSATQNPTTEPSRVFISYAHFDNGQSIRESVLNLIQYLRTKGIDATVDQFYETNPPSQGWPRWMLDEIEKADYVLVVCTPTYYKRFRAHEEIGKGLGATWEGGTITQELYDAGGRNDKFIPVGFVAYATAGPSIPEPLRSTSYRNVGDADGLEMLLRQLHRVPHTTPAPIGQRPSFTTGTISPVAMTPPPAPIPTASRIVDRDKLVNYLMGMDGTSLTRIITRIPGAGQNDPNLQPSPMRAQALINFAESTAGPGLNRLAEVLVDTFPQLSPFV